MAKGIPPCQYYLAPRRLFTLGLGPQEIAIISYLCSLAGPEEVAWPSVRAITKATNVSRRQVFRVLKALCNSGFLDSDSGRDEHRSNSYTVRWGAIGVSSGATQAPSVPHRHGEGATVALEGCHTGTPTDSSSTDSLLTNPPTPQRGKLPDGARVIEWWNPLAERYYLPKLREFGETRMRHLSARKKGHPTLSKDIEEELSRGLSEFVREKNWFSFPWLIRSPENLAKFLEGQYRPKTKASAPIVNQAERERTSQRLLDQERATRREANTRLGIEEPPDDFEAAVRELVGERDNGTTT